MNGDIIVAAGRRTVVGVSVADETAGPFEVYVFYRRSEFLVHDVCEGRGGGREIGDCEVFA